MGADTRIEWADHTFNPWIGCTKVSLACDHCYAEPMATNRLGVDWGPHASRRRTAPSNWKQPLAWNRKAEREGIRRRVFCASLADVFDNHGSITSEWRGDLWHLINSTPHLDWLLLTKRPQNIPHMLPDGYGLPDWGDGWPNVWIGTTVENQREADRRIPHLFATSAAVRFLSCEPLLGPVDLRNIDPTGHQRAIGANGWSAIWKNNGLGRPWIDWVIVGGESGSHARPMHPNWVRSLRDQCQHEGVPFFFKQWGEWLVGERQEIDDDPFACFYQDGHIDHPGWSDGWDIAYSAADDHSGPPKHIGRAHWADGQGNMMRRVGKHAAGRMLDGRTWDEAPR